MVGLSQEAAVVLSLPQLFQACTGEAPSREFSAAPTERAEAFRAINLFLNNPRFQTDADVDAWYPGCLTRMVGATGPRGQVLTKQEFTRLVSSGNFEDLPRPVAPADDVAVVVPSATHLYIRLRHFDKALPADLTALLRAQAVPAELPKVLDLRGNSGGILEVSHWLLAALGRNQGMGNWTPVRFRPTFAPTRPFMPQEMLSFRAFAAPGVTAPTPEERAAWSGGKWVVLIDKDTSHNAAWLAAALQEMNGALLVGATADSDTAGVEILRPLPRGDLVHAVRYKTGRLGLPSGALLEPGAVTPDVPVNTPKPAAYPRNAAQWAADPLYAEVVLKVIPGPLAESGKKVKAKN